jgi:excisionase family DNA binding protein
MNKILHTVDELAEILGIGRSKAWELVYNGSFEVVRIGRSVRVTRASVDNFVRTKAQPAIEQDFKARAAGAHLEG